MTNEEAKNTLKSLKEYYNDKNEDSYVGFDNQDNEALDLAIKALEQQPCEDCISREAVLDIWHTRYSNIREENEEIQYKKIAFELPSVTPQQKATGSWVEKQVVDNEEVEIEQWQSARCSKCDKYHTTPYSYYFDDYNYCPNCGAKMEVEDE